MGLAPGSSPSHLSSPPGPSPRQSPSLPWLQLPPACCPVFNYHDALITDDAQRDICSRISLLSIWLPIGCLCLSHRTASLVCPPPSPSHLFFPPQPNSVSATMFTCFLVLFFNKNDVELWLSHSPTPKRSVLSLSAPEYLPVSAIVTFLLTIKQPSLSSIYSRPVQSTLHAAIRVIFKNMYLIVSLPGLKASDFPSPLGWSPDLPPSSICPPHRAPPSSWPCSSVPAGLCTGCSLSLDCSSLSSWPPASVLQVSAYMSLPREN